MVEKLITLIGEIISETRLGNNTEHAVLNLRPSFLAIGTGRQALDHFHAVHELLATDGWPCHAIRKART